MYPSREEFTELIYYISELKHQYSNKIDEQTIKINDQTGVIEELLWQIRELSDKLRQMSQKVTDMEKAIADGRRKSEAKICVCRYENHTPRNRSIFSRQTSSARNPPSGRKLGTKIAEDKTVDDDDNDVYETIEFSDSSSNVYTEPIREYGMLRKVSIKTSPRPSPRQNVKKKTSSGLKKSTGTRNLQKYTAMEDVSKAADENEPKVELRVKSEVNHSDVRATNNNSLVSVGCRSGIYSHRKFGQLYPTTRCFGYFNQFRMFKFKAAKKL